MTMQVDKARLGEVEAAARAMCVEGGFDPDEIVSNDGSRWRYYAPGAVAAIRSLRSTEGKEGEIEQLTRERDEAWEARNENAKLKGQRDAALARIKEMQDSNSRMAEAFGKLTDRAEAAEAHAAKLREALTPSGGTKAAYSGEFFEHVEIANPMFEDNEDDEPETIMQSVPVSWTTIKEIMAAISARAALTRSPE